MYVQMEENRWEIFSFPMCNMQMRLLWFFNGEYFLPYLSHPLSLESGLGWFKVILVSRKMFEIEGKFPTQKESLSLFGTPYFLVLVIEPFFISNGSAEFINSNCHFEIWKRKGGGGGIVVRKVLLLICARLPFLIEHNPL